MSVESFDAGSKILLEVEFKTRQPFGDLDYADPDDYPTVTITDPDGTVKVTAKNLTKSTTGKWYYECQSATDWIAGFYVVQIDSEFGGSAGDDDVTIDYDNFQIKPVGIN